MITFYDPDCNEASNSLPIEESRHGLKSLRIRLNEDFDVINGKGLKLHAVMIGSDNGILEYKIQRVEKNKRSTPKLHMAVSPLKQADRFEYFIEKATELGVDQITPILCKRTEKPRINAKRLERIIVSGMKQSGNSFMPKLNDLTNISDLIQNSKEDLKYIGHCEEGQKTHLKNIDFSTDALFIVGPEGDFDENEIKLAMENGFKSITLGDLTLRTETAALSLSSYFQLSK